MKVVVFLGPTLSHEDACNELDATYLSPVAQGDVYRVAKERPFAIGIVDGFFERVPSVWHKEILWAISKGIHVFGAASMGALRAAELAPFGMRGVGVIFDAFRAGTLEDDDEVAVAHGDANAAYRATSEAMVNIRATLLHAERSRVISGDVRERLEAIAKGLFYADRSYPRVSESALAAGIARADVERLREFVTRGRVDQKRTDAILMLRTVADCVAGGAAPEPSAFSFSHTEAWDQVVDWADCQPALTGASETISANLVAAEVRRTGAAGRAVFAAGLNSVAASELARRVGAAAEDDEITKVDERVRRRWETQFGAPRVDNAKSFETWLERQGLTQWSYRLFLEQQWEIDWLRRRYCEDVDRRVVSELRMADDYARYCQRARHKQAVLDRHGLQEPTLSDGGLTADELLSWYFAQRLECPMPSDLSGFLSSIGLPDVVALEREALREFLYSRLAPDPDPLRA